MRVLVAHNYYQQPGGEDGVFEGESRLLSDGGHEVVPFVLHNDAVGDMGTVRLAASTVWSLSTYRAVRDLIRKQKVDIVHVHNTLPLISPSIFHAAATESVPAVQTLHNYRLACPQAQFFREGSVCEECLGKFIAWPGIRHRCYRESLAASAGVASMLAAHRMLRTWSRKVSLFIALTGFAKSKLMQGGIAGEQIFVKPNFLHPDPGIGTGRGGYALFVGRLSPEKGLRTLLQAWTRLSKPDLKIVGDGPLFDELRERSLEMPNVELLGRKTKEDVLRLMQDAKLLVFPSEWYEGFPMTMIEAMATGLPIVASRIGSLQSIVKDGETGQLFESGSAEQLARAVTTLDQNDPELQSMRSKARSEFESNYTATRNYAALMRAYERATSRAMESAGLSVNRAMHQGSSTAS